MLGRSFGTWRARVARARIRGVRAETCVFPRKLNWSRDLLSIECRGAAGELRLDEVGRRSRARNLERKGRPIRRAESVEHPQLELGLVPPRRRGDQLADVLARHVRREHPRRGQMDAAGGERVEQSGNGASRASDLDALVRLVVGELQLAHAVGVHRRVPGGRVEPTVIDFGDVGEQDCGDRPVPRDDRSEFAEQRFVAQRLQRGGAHGRPSTGACRSSHG
jgi:hypothetical protein